jgi:hypothetical protein
VKYETLEGSFPAVVLPGDSPEAFNTIERPSCIVPQRRTLEGKRGAVELPTHLHILPIWSNESP